VNHAIVYLLQDVFNLLPDVTNPEWVRSMFVKTNDGMLVVYVTALTRSILALHNLINNKLANRETEKKDSAPPVAVKKEGAAAGTEKKEGDKDKDAATHAKDAKDTKEASSNSKESKEK
jgi:26S proteasome regulatory subunit N8